jgi:8-oxo-dGTP pyrophosphatase MutT (NUDIX family)
MTTVDDLRRAMERVRRRKVPLARLLTRAAVAAVALSTSRGVELLFIRRSERDGDRWSGHMAFPGGRVERADADALHAARRETREEIALDLTSGATLLGPLSQVPTLEHGRPLPMVIEPFVFLLDVAPPPPVLSDEVQEVVWVPLDFFRDEKNRGTLPWRGMKMPCYRWEERPIWGLTLRMVDELVAALTK